MANLLALDGWAVRMALYPQDGDPSPRDRGVNAHRSGQLVNQGSGENGNQAGLDSGGVPLASPAVVSDDIMCYHHCRLLEVAVLDLHAYVVGQRSYTGDDGDRDGEAHFAP